MLRSFFTRNVYMPFSDALQGESMFRFLRELEASQYLQPEVLAELQFAQVCKSVEAAALIPYYRERGDSGKVSSWDEFRALPVLEKVHLWENFERLRNPGRRDSVAQTSGSTGKAVRFCHGPEFRSRHGAGQWRARGWFGVRPGDAVLAVWGRPLGTGSERAVLQLKSRLNNILHVSAFDLNPDSIRDLYPQIRRLRPRLVYAYPSGIEALARQAEADGVRLDDLGVRVVACTGEVMYGFQREVLGRVFGAPVEDVYGCSEFGAFAHQCPEGGMHIACENVLVEFLDEHDQPVPVGSPGQVVVTSLHNPSMPLIRYRVGDVAVPLEGPCPCGRNLPRMDVRAGRVGQMVRTAGGRLFSSMLFDHAHKRLIAAGHREIDAFHVVQTGLEDFVVRYVTQASEPQAALQAYEAGMREVIGTQARISFEKVPEIPRHPGGKLGYFSCEIPVESGS